MVGRQQPRNQAYAVSATPPTPWRGQLPLLAGTLLLLAGCTSLGAAASGPTAVPKPAPAVDASPPTPTPNQDYRQVRPPQIDCPKLDGALTQLVAAPDPARYAAGGGIEYDDGRVAIGVEFVTPGEQGDLAQPYGLQIQARGHLGLSALAPLSMLCDLAQDSRVRLVRPLRRTSPN